MKRALSLLACLALCGFAAARAGENRIGISYVKSPFNLQMIVMKERGLLEKELEPLGVTADWLEINSGAKQVQALASGDLDVAGVMNTTSLLMSASEGVPLGIIAGVARPTDVFAILGRKGGPATIRDLKGATVAGPMGTVLHQLLAAALEREGMSMRDVRFVSMDIPQSFAALQGGKVDAALLAANMVIKAEEEGAVKLATATGYIVPKLAVVASGRFIEAHPDRVRAVVAAHDAAWRWIADNHDEAIALGAKIQGIGVADAELFFSWSHFTQRMNDGDKKSMEEDMEFLLDNGMMRRKVDIDELFIPSAME